MELYLDKPYTRSWRYQKSKMEFNTLSTLEFHLMSDCLPLFSPEAGNTDGHLLDMMGSDNTQHHIQKRRPPSMLQSLGCSLPWSRGWHGVGAWLCCLPHQRVLSFTSPGKDQNSTFKVHFLLNTYFFCTFVKLKNQSQTIISLGPSEQFFCNWYIPAFPVLKTFGDYGNTCHLMEFKI